jgi:acetyl-CoA synthetase
MVPTRDFFVDELLKNYRGVRVEPVPMDAEAPLFLMYTSGTTGKPKGCQHRTGGYLSYVTGTSKYIQDIHPEDVYWCMADIGWITGHSYIVYGPLAIAASAVIYEGVPVYPDAGRPWRIAERLGVNIFHTSPTAIRMLRKAGGDEPKKYDYHFKHMTTVGEPIEPEVWKWYYDVVGKGEAVIVDTWWQTETGGFLCSTKPALDPMKPGSAGPGMPGVYPYILDEQGREMSAGTRKAGNICIKNPWPGAFQTIWGDRDRFVRQYYAKYCKNPKSKDWRDWPYFAADGALHAADGYFRILGRVDDVINVAGHRLGTREIEECISSHPNVAEVAVVGVADQLKGQVAMAFAVLKDPSRADTPAAALKLEGEIMKVVDEQLGAVARPSRVRFVGVLPKTRSGKLLRRAIQAVCEQRDPGDLTTIEDPTALQQIKDLVST